MWKWHGCIVVRGFRETEAQFQENPKEYAFQHEY